MVTFSKLGEEKSGRLGNQLFQIAGTIGVAQQNNVEFVFPSWKYNKHFKHILPQGQLENAVTYKQEGVHFYNIILGRGNWDLQGFFQSERFFKNAEEKVRYYLQPSDDIKDYIDKKYGGLLQSPTCSVHVRRGDYIEQKYHFPPQPIQYYTEAIATFDLNTKFIFFSDDINWCKANFKAPNFYFIENETDILDLFLMSRCNNHIISNSSFSWWGAWLNPLKEKKVICPEYWFGPAVAFNVKKYAKDIYAEGFRKLPLSHKNFIEKNADFFNPLFFIAYKIYQGIKKATKNLLQIFNPQKATL